MENPKKIGLLKSIKGRLVLYFVLLLVLPFMFLGLMAYQSEKAALEKRITGQLTSIADIQKGRIRTWLSERMSEARYIAGDTHIVRDFETLKKSADPARNTDTRMYRDILSQLESIKKNHGYVDIFILDENGRVIVSTVERELGDSRRSEGYFTGTLKAGLGGRYIQDIYKDPHYGVLAMDFAVPIRSYSAPDKIGGVAVLVLGMDKSFFPIIEDRPGMGPTGDTLIGRREGGRVVFLNRLTFKPDAPLSFGFPLDGAPEPILDATGGKEGIVVAPDYRGVKVLAATRYVPETGWGLVVKEDYDDAFAPVTKLYRWVLAVMGAALLMVVMLIYTVSTRIADPIAKLNEFSRKIAAGDFSGSLPIRRQDEIGSLAESFNEMAYALETYKKDVEEKKAALEDANRQLRSLAEGLEVKVAERTYELEESRDRIKENLDIVERANVELRRMDRIKDHFLGMMSHELRTPLSLITGYSSNLLSDSTLKLDRRVEDAIEGIYKGSERLRTIVSEMLDISQIDARGLRLIFTPANVGTIIEEVLKELGSFIRERKHTIELADFSDAPDVYLDRKRMHQVLVNIISNAIKFTPDGGVIGITEKRWPADSEFVRAHGGEGEGDYIDVVVKDGGIGISKEEAERIFEKFYEAGEIEKHTTSKYRFLGRGVGLGLPIARGIVEAHNGKLWVESEGYDPVSLPGSSFHMLLPVGREVTVDGLLDRFGERVKAGTPQNSVD